MLLCESHRYLSICLSLLPLPSIHFIIDLSDPLRPLSFSTAPSADRMSNLSPGPDKRTGLSKKRALLYFADINAGPGEPVERMDLIKMRSGDKSENLLLRTQASSAGSLIIIRETDRSRAAAADDDNYLNCKTSRIPRWMFPAGISNSMKQESIRASNFVAWLFCRRVLCMKVRRSFPVNWFRHHVPHASHGLTSILSLMYF